MTDDQDIKPGAPAAPPAAAPPAAAPPAAPPVPKIDPLKAAVPSAAVDQLKARFPDQVTEVDYHVGEPIVRLKKDRFVEVAAFLRDQPDLRFDYLSNLTAVHWPKRPLPF